MRVCSIRNPRARVEQVGAGDILPPVVTAVWVDPPSIDTSAAAQSVLLNKAKAGQQPARAKLSFGLGKKK